MSAPPIATVFRFLRSSRRGLSATLRALCGLRFGTEKQGTPYSTLNPLTTSN